MVTDFSAGVLLMGQKFCMAVWSNLGQVFSHFQGKAPGMAEFWASTGAIWQDMALAEAVILQLSSGLCRLFGELFQTKS